MPTKRSLQRAEAENKARAKRLEAIGSNGGLFMGAMLGALYAAPRVNDWGFAWTFGIAAICALGGMLLGTLMVGWMVGSAATWSCGDYSDLGGGDGDCGGGDA